LPLSQIVIINTTEPASVFASAAKKKRWDFQRLEFEQADLPPATMVCQALLGGWLRAAQQVGKHAALFG
jgi:hypothetical protein